MGTISIPIEADVATRRDSALAAGLGDHLPVGYWSGAIYRSALRFAKPAWADWTSITKATLKFYISDHQHVGVRNSTIYVRRMSPAAPWTKAAGTQDCESGFTGGNNTQADDVASVSTNQSSFASGTTANAKKEVSVTLMTREYFAADSAKLVYVLDPASSSDYTEVWSREKGSTYDAVLEIEYVESTVPDYPTNVAPTTGSTVDDQTPRFSWVHNSPSAQTGARVRLYGADGTTLIAEHTVVGAAAFIDWPDTLNRGQTYVWQVFTSNVYGEGPGSAGWSFTIRALPVVTIVAARKMTFDAAAHQPRLVVQWSANQPQTSYRVTTASGYDSGDLPGAATSHVIARNLTNGTAETVTVTVTSTGLSGSASRSFTPRWGLTTQRRDVGATPVISWETPVIVGTVAPDQMLVPEYGATPNSGDTAPPAWFSSVSSIPKARYLFHRVWFIPGATTGPTLDSINIPVNRTVPTVDKWGTTKDTPGLTGVWSIDPGESVYGTRSMRADVSGAGPFLVYSYKVRLRANRTYILTGLMKSQGNSGASFRLVDALGNTLKGGGILEPPDSLIESARLIDTAEWFDEARHDTTRYRTPGFLAKTDMDAWIVLRVGGTAGTTAWFDAIKLEESTVATPWSPGAIGAVVVDAGGLQVDGNKGGVWRYRGTGGALRDTVEGGASGLKFGGDTEVSSPADGVLAVDGINVSLAGHGHASLMGSALVAGPQSGISAATDLTGATVAFTAVAGHAYLVNFGTNAQSTVADDVAQFRLMEGAAVLDLSLFILAAAARSQSAARVFVLTGLSAGAHTLKLNALRNNGTGTLTFSNTYLNVVDLG
jgi:hypothetical protein